MKAYFHLDTRAVFSVSGDEAASFLTEILTADIEGMAHGQMRQSCLLSPQGRILIEMQLYRASDSLLYIACDRTQRDELVKKLKFYRLRRPITITSSDEIALLACDTPLLPRPPILICPDERAPDMGHHALIESKDLDAFACQPQSLYQARRIANAIPEGAADLTPNRALMLEAGLDLFSAVDFQKGCYIGQEVTARTRYRGLVKRRLIPVKGTNLAPDQPLLQDGKSIGQLLSIAPSQDQMIGLASLKLTAIHDAIGGKPLLCDDQPVSLAIPDHLLPLPALDQQA